MFHWEYINGDLKHVRLTHFFYSFTHVVLVVKSNVFEKINKFKKTSSRASAKHKNTCIKQTSKLHLKLNFKLNSLYKTPSHNYGW